jgi:hypothetical protein
LSPGRVLLDGQTVPRAAGEGKGWSKNDGTLIIRILDDGLAHKIEIE